MQAIQDPFRYTPNEANAILLCFYGHCVGRAMKEYAILTGQTKLVWITLAVDMSPCRININKRKTDLESLAHALSIAHVQTIVWKL